MNIGLTSETVQSALGEATKLTANLAETILSMSDEAAINGVVRQDPIYQTSEHLRACNLTVPIIEAGCERILDPKQLIAVLALDGPKWQETLRSTLLNILAVGFYSGFVASMQQKATLSVEDLEKYFEL